MRSIKLTLILSFFICIQANFAQDSLHLIATMTGEEEGDEFSNVIRVGDVNGDGFDDILTSRSLSWTKRKICLGVE